MRKYTSLFQPFLFALLCLLLVALFFVTALIDLRRTQNTLLDVFENKGLTIIDTVEMIAQDKFKGLMGTTGQAVDFLQDLDRVDEGFRMKEAILGKLIELGREVDRREEENSLSKQVLEQLAVQAGMQAIVVYDDSDRTILESAPIPKESAAGIKILLEKRDEIGFDLNGEGTPPSYLVAVRKKNKKGMIVLVFGAEGFRYWAISVAIQEAIEEGGWRKGVHYFMVVDPRGFVLAGAGDLPEAREGGDMQSMVEQIRMKDRRSTGRIISGSPERLAVYAPLQIDRRAAGTAWIGLEIEEAIRIRESNQAHILVTTGLMMLGALLAMLLFYRIQNRHLQRIQVMKDRLFQADRLSSLGKLAAGVAHEIRNPLNAISMAIQRIQREFEPIEPQYKKEFSHIVTVVREEIGRLNRIIEDFVGPARVRHNEFRPLRLAGLLEQVVRLAREEASSRDVRIECRWPDSNLVIPMDPVRMHQAIFNLIKNALEAIEGSGTIIITARPLDSKHAVITIKDNGVGIPAEIIQQILDYDYTTKEKGLGLGLPIAKEIIQAHGGELKIESEPGKGTMLELILPVQRKNS